MSYIPATAPTTIPPTDAKVYDKWWVSRLEIIGTDPPMVNARAELRKFRTLADGSIGFGPDAPTVVNDLDLLTQAAGDPELATLLGMIFQRITALGTEQGVL